MRQRIILGNWKMNGDSSAITNLLNDILKQLSLTIDYQCAVFPPSPYLNIAKEILINTSIMYGAQNVYPANNGAFTGEISGPMLADLGCKYVLVGHSERRQLFHESNEFIAQKFHHARDSGIVPVLCIGETLEERENNLTEKSLAKQLLTIVKNNNSHDNPFENCIIAYEPVWAIGTGKTATPIEIQEVHAFVRNLIAQFGEVNAELLPIIYGGSVNEKNCLEIFNMPDVDGGLIGGASLDAEKFAEIVKPRKSK
ncbi:MAG: triose-phosphate isomerase [Legionellales bacterium RIFCSPHIGHO2_12_FULL_35_11]|nr:MAG: triose-phosphate isomerase [Legionellales bacterium RIFCSPHIGHO2_12_FULL_35_11]